MDLERLANLEARTTTLETTKDFMLGQLSNELTSLRDRVRVLERPDDTYVIASVTGGRLDGGLRIDCRGQRMVLDAYEAEYIADALVKTVRDLRK